MVYLYKIGTAIVEKERFESDPQLQRLLRNVPLGEYKEDNGKTYLRVYHMCEDGCKLYVKPPIL